jgi:hypothetical protein
MYKGTTQPVYISVFNIPVPPATVGTPVSLSTATALWVCVNLNDETPANPTIVLTKNCTGAPCNGGGTSAISVQQNPNSDDTTPNTLYFEIVPGDFSDSSTGLIAGQYSHEARVIIDSANEYVVYPYPPQVPPVVATFSVIKSLTRGAEYVSGNSGPKHTDSLERMPPAYLEAHIPAPKDDNGNKVKTPKNVAPSYKHAHKGR